MNFNPLYLQDSDVSPEDVNSFRQAYLKLNEEIQQELTLGNNAPIGDGPLNPEGYLKAKTKILWLMKEPYDTDKGVTVDDIKTGGWYFTDEMFKKKGFGRDRTTWYPIINASHAILTGQATWKAEERMSKSNKGLVDVLSHIGYVNIQKLASQTREKTDNTLIQTAFKTNISWLQNQFELLNPDIIIGANTINGAVFEHFGLKGKQLKSSPSDEAYVANGKLFIRAKHPAQRGNKETYINDILSAVQAWKQIIINATAKR